MHECPNGHLCDCDGEDLMHGEYDCGECEECAEIEERLDAYDTDDFEP